MAARISNSAWPYKWERVEETPFERVVRMLSNELDPPWRNVIDDEAITVPASCFLLPDSWKERFRRDSDEAPGS